MHPKPEKILFQGDSITDAFRKPDEINPAYRLGNGYAFLVAARLGARFPGRFEFFNRGISGQGVEDLADRWEEDALLLRPDTVSLLVGVNNVLLRNQRGAGLADAEVLATYRSLLDRLRERNPDIRLLLLEPFLVETGMATRKMIADLEPIQRGTAGLAAEFDAAFIPLQNIFCAALEQAPAGYWAYDGVHPTHAGFQLIAEAWLQAFESLENQQLTPALSTPPPAL